MATKPSILSPWATSDLNNGPGSSPNKVQPDSSKQTDGWDYNEIVPRNWWNYQLNNTYEWLLYMKELTENTLDGALNFGYDADNSTGLTFQVFTKPYRQGPYVRTPAGSTDSVVLTDDDVNYVVYNLTDNNLEAHITNTSIDTKTSVLIYEVTTAAGAITEVKDLRNMTGGQDSFIVDNNSKVIVRENSVNNADIYFQAGTDVVKSVGWNLVGSSDPKFAHLRTKIDDTPNTVFTLNLQDDTVEFVNDVTFNAANTVTFGATPSFPATNTLTEDFEFDGTVDLDGTTTINGNLTTNGTTDINGASLTVDALVTNFNDAVTFAETPSLPANNTFTENFEFDGTVQIDGTATVNGVLDINNTTTIDGATTITGTTIVNGNFTQNTGTFDFNGNGQFDGTVDFNAAVVFNSTVDLNNSVNPNDLTDYTAGNYVEVEQVKGFTANQSPTDEMSFISPRGGVVRCRVTITITEDGTGGPVTCNVQRKKNGVDEGAVVTHNHNNGTSSLTHDLDITLSDNDTIEIEVEITGVASSDNIQVEAKLAVANPSKLSYDMTA